MAKPDTLEADLIEDVAPSFDYQIIRVVTNKVIFFI